MATLIMHNPYAVDRGGDGLWGMLTSGYEEQISYNESEVCIFLKVPSFNKLENYLDDVQKSKFTFIIT